MKWLKRIVARLNAGSRAEKALAFALEHGGSGDDGEDNANAWVIDQVVRILAGEDYDKLIADESAKRNGVGWATGQNGW